MIDYVPEQGDIAFLDFTPSAGREMVNPHPCYVISRRLFSEHTGFAIVAPITSTVRGLPLEVKLPESLDTHGVILVHQLRSLDYGSSACTFIEKAPAAVRTAVNGLVQLITQHSA